MSINREICIVQNLQAKEYSVRDLPYTPRPLITTTRQAISQAQILLEYFNAKDKPTELKHNRPDVVRKALITYLQHHFPHGEAFEHPLTKQRFANKLVFKKLYALKQNKQEAPEKRMKAIPPKVVRKAFLSYLRESFPTGLPFKHPSNRETYSNGQLRQTFDKYKSFYNGICCLQYRSLWALFTSQASRAFISREFSFSDSNVQHLWNEATDAVMLMVRYPELVPESTDSRAYQALYAWAVSGATRATIAEEFKFSDSSIKRLWNDTLDILLCMLMYPDVPPSRILYMYRSRG